eukprot:UN06787
MSGRLSDEGQLNVSIDHGIDAAPDFSDDFDEPKNKKSKAPAPKFTFKLPSAKDIPKFGLKKKIISTKGADESDDWTLTPKIPEDKKKDDVKKKKKKKRATITKDSLKKKLETKCAKGGYTRQTGKGFADRNSYYKIQKGRKYMHSGRKRRRSSSVVRKNKNPDVVDRTEIRIKKELEREVRQKALYSDWVGKKDVGVNDDGKQDLNEVEATPETNSLSSLSDEELDKKMYEVLKEKFKLEEFRIGQKDTIKRIIQKKSTLLILPTGGGKTLTYQMPAVMFTGITLVITPLMALMKDQCESLPDGVTGAVWNSSKESDDIRAMIRDLHRGLIDVLFVSPERLCSPSFQRHIINMERKLEFVCIDEAHCVSEWSHNFRPSYLRIHRTLVEVFKVKCVLALTATATTMTELSICKHLPISNQTGVIRIDRPRTNLHLSISQENSKMNALIKLLESEPFKDFKSMIIYVMYKRDATEIAQSLKMRKYNACAYHGGMENMVRVELQDQFMNNEIRIMVATIAFGMGLDKSDIRGIIHYSVPQTMEHYVQEIGRAGRDGEPSYCHVFFHTNDLTLRQSLVYSDGIDVDQVKHILSLIFAQGKKKLKPIGTVVAIPLDTIPKKVGR